jgi:hypothetical protein
MGQHVRHRPAMLRFGEQPERPALYACYHGGLSVEAAGTVSILVRPEYPFSPFSFPMTFIAPGDLASSSAIRSSRVLFSPAWRGAFRI